MSRPTTSSGLVAAAADEQVDLVVVGPEAPLVAGSPTRSPRPGSAASARAPAAAALEGSKAFCKEVMAAAGVPTAALSRSSTTPRPGWRRSSATRSVIKADGLAAGKGVMIAAGRRPRRAARSSALLVERRFGTERVVVEEHLEGEELSLLALCDGRRALPLASAQDYKRIFDGDRGPNTGGMGSYSPVPAVDERARRARSASDPPAGARRARAGAASRSTACSTPG